MCSSPAESSRQESACGRPLSGQSRRFNTVGAKIPVWWRATGSRIFRPRQSVDRGSPTAWSADRQSCSGCCRPGDGDLVVVAAPAGYGKTIATALWDEADEREFAWVRIDHLDDDPVHLLLHIATAVESSRTGIDRGLLGYLRGPGRAPLTHLVPAIVPRHWKRTDHSSSCSTTSHKISARRHDRHVAHLDRRRTRIDDHAGLLGRGSRATRTGTPQAATEEWSSSASMSCGSRRGGRCRSRGCERTQR